MLLEQVAVLHPHRQHRLLQIQQYQTQTHKCWIHPLHHAVLYAECVRDVDQTSILEPDELGPNLGQDHNMTQTGRSSMSRDRCEH